MMTHPLPIAGKSSIKTLVARQLPTNKHTHTTQIYTRTAHKCTHTHTHTHTHTSIVHFYMYIHKTHFWYDILSSNYEGT